jgi:hypothetical protein
MPWQKGQSGNPKGRQPGSRNRATLAAEELLDGDADQLMGKALELAKQGNLAMLRFCIERILPVRRSRAVSIPLGDLNSLADLAQAQLAVLQAMARGELSPEDAETASRALDTAGSALQRVQWEERLVALEAHSARFSAQDKEAA